MSRPTSWSRWRKPCGVRPGRFRFSGLFPATNAAGRGASTRRLSRECKGRGEVARTETYQVKIPVGVYEGQLLRLSGQESTAGVMDSPGTCSCASASRSIRNIGLRTTTCITTWIAPWDAVLGTTVSIPLLDGQANLKIPAGARNGQRFRLRGKGIPSGEAGAATCLPSCASRSGTCRRRERALWEQLRSESTSSAKG